MSVPAHEEWFSASIRRNRKSYILASILLTSVLGGVVLFLWLVDGFSSNTGYVVLLVFFIPYAVASYLLTAQRLRDFNLSGWLALLWIPVGTADNYVGGAASLAFFIILATVPGTIGANRYGPDPLREADARA